MMVIAACLLLEHPKTPSIFKFTYSVARNMKSSLAYHVPLLVLFGTMIVIIVIITISSIGAENVAVTPFASTTSTSGAGAQECVVEKSSSTSRASYNISHCETVTCLEGKGDYPSPSCDTARMNTVLNLTCDGDAICYSAQVSNIQDGGTVLCRGGDACSGSRFAPAENASYTHICDNSMAMCAACEETTFPDGFGPKGTLICGRNYPCDYVKLGVSIENDPDLCVLCAFSKSCFGITDVDGKPAEPRPYGNSTLYPFLTIIGNGCGPSDMAKLRDFYWDTNRPKLVSWKTLGCVVLMISILRVCVLGAGRRWPHVFRKNLGVNIFEKGIHMKSLPSPAPFRKDENSKVSPEYGGEEMEYLLTKKQKEPTSSTP